MKRAYRTTWNGIISIVAAESVAQARSRTQASANSAGYGPKWCEIRVARATEHDGWAEVDETAIYWDEESLPKRERDDMSKFKAGDRVVVTDGMYKSKLGIVIEESGLRFLVRLDEGLREVWIQANRLALLSQCAPVQDDDDDEADGKPTMTAECGTVTDLDEWNAANKYAREIYTLEGNVGTIDVYRVLDAYKVTDQAVAHALKKLLMPGERGSKGVIQDLEEAAFSIKQAVELLKQKGGG